MLSLCFVPKTLASHFPTGTPKWETSSPDNDRRFKANCCNPQRQTERSVEFETGGAFYRHESSTGRDLGVLAASIYRQSKGSLRVLDAMCGCGVRSCRYLKESEADFVMANDANDEYRGLIEGNLKQVVDEGLGEEKRWMVCHSEANRVLSECYLQRDFFDLIDIDSFGSESAFLRSAMLALRLGGLLYLTSTDGYTSGGHRPHHSLDAYGAFVRPLPFSNEIGLRMLIGGAVREAAVLGYHVTPLFSYYAYHGPVFRVMLRMNREKLHENRDYGFIGYCTRCGHSQPFSWKELGKIGCSCRSSEGSHQPFAVSGPMWIGPLHSGDYITQMSNLATEWGWIGNGAGVHLDKLLNQMLDESDPRLPPGYIKLDEITKRAKINGPPLMTMLSSLHSMGYAASRSHIAPNAIKTDCPMAILVKLAKELVGIPQC
ncbi:tRNA (guanine(26)-N(2))-dimethyltransferase [Linum perenne]